MLYQQRKYINFLFKSTNHHGVHSPFIFNFITKSLYKKTNKKSWQLFTKHKHKLLDNKKFIEVTDFGSGSKIFKSNLRQVAKIAKIAGISNKKGKILLKIINYFKPNAILEIGTSLGLATAVMKIAHPSTIITTLEGCPETSKVADAYFTKSNFNSITIVTGNFNKTLAKVVKDKQYDCIYFDGNHTKKATINYFETCLESAHNNSLFIFDDIYWNSEMQEAWQEIKNNNKISVTLDLFYFGIVFFRKEQAKEDFKIRI